MTEDTKVALESPRKEAGAALLIAGMIVRYTNETVAGIPMQWQRFEPYIGTMPNRVNGMSYGVCRGFDDTGHFDYVSGVAVSSLADLPAELSGIRVPAQTYLVFNHRGHVSGIHATWQAIIGDWFPASGYKMTDGPGFERYGEDFDGRTGLGTTEIWIPIVS